MTTSDRHLADGRIEWGKESWKLAEKAVPKSAPSLTRTSGVEGYLGWRGRLSDAIAMVGH